jgi:hypothetical protein
VIDLHLHTIASDGRLEPEALVARAYAAGLTVMSVTDHDTTAALPAVHAAAAAVGLIVVPGIEVTAVLARRDVHVLGYFIDPFAPVLVEFLAGQRADRVRRAVEMGERLAALGAPIDTTPMVERGNAPGERAVGRPQIAQALVAEGHVETTREAFDRFIGQGKPAFVPRQGATPADVVDIIGRAGGVASLAHPALLGRDDIIPALADAGLTALEAYHGDHDAATGRRYVEMAEALGLLVTGGSDFHGDESHHYATLGSVGLPEADYRALAERAGAAGSRP